MTAGSRDRADALRHNGGYRRLWSAVVVSQAGDWLLFIALPLWVLHRSGSALATSGVFLAELVPAVVAGIAGGPLIDRFGHRLLAGLTAAQAVVLLPLLWIAPGEVWVVYGVAGAQAALTSITTPAQQALVPALVGPAQRTRANGLVEAAGNVARLAGSPLGGALLPVVGLSGLVAGDAVSFVIAAALLAGCRPIPAPEPAPVPPAGPAAPVPPAAPAAPAAPMAEGDGGPGGIRAGWRAARRSPMLRAGVAVSAVTGMAQGLFLVLFVLFVVRSLHAGDGVVGMLRGVQAIGGVTGGIVVAAVAARVGNRRLTVWGLALFGAISLLNWDSPAFTLAPAWYALLFILVGIPGTAFVTGMLSEVQTVCPPAVLGRVLSLAGVAEAAGQGAGVMAAGAIGAVVPLGVLLNAQGCLYLTAAVVAAAGFRAARRTPVTTWPQMRATDLRGSGG